MQKATFKQNLAKKIPANQVINANNFAYVSWANMLRGAEFPAHSCISFNGKPGMEIFGGVVVAVDMETPHGIMQRIWLPVLDEENVAISAMYSKGGTLALVQSAIARCRAKAVAMTCGYGLSLYAGYGGDGQAFDKDLNVEPGHDIHLADIDPIGATKGDNGPEYLRWASALAAAYIRYPAFRWQIDFFDDADGVSRPYMKAGEGFFVSVTTDIGQSRHTEILPIMDVWSYVPMTTPTTADWNRAVMRCLAKAIATHTGYGISLYTTDEPVLEGHEPPSQEDIDLLDEALAAHGRTVKELLAWLGVQDGGLADLTRDQCDRSLVALGVRKPQITFAANKVANTATPAENQEE